MRALALKIVVALGVVSLLAACSHASVQHPKSSSTSTSPSTTSQPTTKPRIQFSVVDWGVTPDGLLSVRVTNSGVTTIESARAIITARDVNGNAIATVSAPSGYRCCTVVGLAPGLDFGLYADLGASAARTAKVDVQYTNIVRAKPSDPVPILTASHISMSTSHGTAIVSTRLGMRGKGGPYITAQAFLKNPSGKLVAVISGGFYCFTPGHSRVIKLQFFHPLPANTTVGSVEAFPIGPVTDKADPLPACTPTPTSSSSPAAAPTS
jgi:hypothetical protein